MSEPAFASCVNHPQRGAIGVCVKCRSRVCGECTTKVDGINYCVGCLGALALAGTRAERARGRLGGRALPYLATTTYFAVLCLALWVLLEALLPGGG